MQGVGQALSAIGNIASGFMSGTSGMAPAAGGPAAATADPNRFTPFAGSSTPSTSGFGAGGFGLKDALGLAAIVGQAIQGVQNFTTSQNLQNPDFIAHQISKIERQQLPALIAAEAPGVESQFAEAGLSGAPGLIAQGISQAVTPQVLQSAPQDYFSALSASQGYGGGQPGFVDIGKLLGDLYPSS